MTGYALRFLRHIDCSHCTCRIMAYVQRFLSFFLFSDGTKSQSLLMTSESQRPQQINLLNWNQNV